MLGYFQQSKRCQLAGLPKSVLEPLDADKDTDEPPKELPPCLSFRMRDDDLDVLARTRAVVPAIHGLFTFFTAMKNAWKLKCRNRCVRCCIKPRCLPLEFLSRRMTGRKRGR